MKNSVFILLLCFCISCSQEKTISVNASKKLHSATDRLNGANVEDLNFQCYGGMYSQLLYGQDFEEHVDVDFMNLSTEATNYKSMTGPARTITFVVLDENGKPYITTQPRSVGINPLGYPVGHTYEINSKRVPGVILPNDSLSEKDQKILIERLTGDKQISRYWREYNTGSAKGVFKLITKGQYKGRRDQLIRFDSGSGEVGIDNMGLLRMGINLEEGKNYEGTLRVKNAKECNLYVALLNTDGKRKLAEKVIKIKASPDKYQKVDFELIPDGSDRQGRFTVILKEPAEIVLGYAFLQPGTWGRVKGGYPIRQDFVNILIDNGMKIIRYNGSMNDRCPDSLLYRWKNMIGPRDERMPYTGTFTPYATHGFGIFEFMMLAEAAGLDGVVGISKDEDPSEIGNMIEYAKGAATTKWGALRAQDGHPDPYNLRYIQIGNEVRVTADRLQDYLNQFRALASEIWKADPEMYLLLSINIRAANNLNTLKNSYQTNPEYLVVRDFMKWVQQQGKEDKIGWDSHYNGRLIEPDSTIYRALGLEMQDVLAADISYKLKLFPLEENGAHHTFERGLTHARLQNHLNRWSNRLEAAATANMFQPEAGFMTFGQGRVFYDSYRFWNQTSGHVDQMFTKEWLPDVLDVKEEAPADSLDVLVKASGDKRVVSLYVTNYGLQPQTREIKIAGFIPKKDATVSQLGPFPFTARNSVNNPDLIKPVVQSIKIGKNGFEYQFPGHSFIVIRMESKSGI
jgi:alpha-N-arabinofuranosidase